MGQELSEGKDIWFTEEDNYSHNRLLIKITKADR